MVLLLKQWKSRSSPGFAAGASKNPFTMLKMPLPSLSERRLFVWRTNASDVGAGWSSPVARQAHNLKVAGSNPAPATNKARFRAAFFVPFAWRGPVALWLTVPEWDSPESAIAAAGSTMRCKGAGLLVPLVVPARFGTPAYWLPSNWLALHPGASLFLIRRSRNCRRARRDRRCRDPRAPRRGRGAAGSATLTAPKHSADPAADQAIATATAASCTHQLVPERIVALRHDRRARAARRSRSRSTRRSRRARGSRTRRGCRRAAAGSSASRRSRSRPGSPPRRAALLRSARSLRRPA